MNWGPAFGFLFVVLGFLSFVVNIASYLEDNRKGKIMGALCLIGFMVTGFFCFGLTTP